MRSLLEWVMEQRSTVAIGAAVVLFAVTLILRYGFQLWWPWGIVMATVLAVVGIAGASRE